MVVTPFYLFVFLFVFLFLLGLLRSLVGCGQDTGLQIASDGCVCVRVYVRVFVSVDAPDEQVAPCMAVMDECWLVLLSASRGHKTRKVLYKCSPLTFFFRSEQN